MKTGVNWLGRWAIVLSMALGAASQAQTQISIGVSVPGVSIGINRPAYPQFEQVSGYPVYYVPESQNNYFFYDGLYWVYQRDNWYSGSWYDGPWYAVVPQRVPLYVLRIPVRYYRDPPPDFRSWRPDAPPRWGERWGKDWQRKHKAWDRWNHQAMPAPAPLPQYQRRYAGDRYPQAEQQRELRGRHYPHQSRDIVVREHLRQQAPPRSNASRAHGRPEAQGQRKQPKNERATERATGPGQGQAKGHDREDGDAPGQRNKK